MSEIKRGNFEFVKEIYPEIYKKIAEVERLAYLNCREAGRTLRIVYEEWLTGLVEEYNIQATQDNDLKQLNDKRIALEEKLPAIHNYPNDVFSFKAVTGNTRSYDAYIGWLMRHVPIIITEALINTVLCGFFGRSLWMRLCFS